jgi:hypothetical protein
VNVNGWWVTGIVDGEGCFRAYPRKYLTTGGNSSRGVNLCFSVTLRADDLPTLLKLRDYFGCGKIYSHHGSNAYARAFRLEMNTRKCWERLIEHFEQYPLQSKKMRDYLIWKDIVSIAVKSQWSIYRSEMVELCKQLQGVKAFDRGTGIITDPNIVRLETA